MDGALSLGWNDKPEQLRLFPKDLCDHEPAGLGQGVCDGAQRLYSVLQRTTSGAWTGPLQSILLWAIQCLRRYQTSEAWHERVRGHRALVGPVAQCCWRQCRAGFFAGGAVGLPWRFVHDDWNR